MNYKFGTAKDYAALYVEEAARREYEIDIKKSANKVEQVQLDDIRESMLMRQAEHQSLQTNYSQFMESVKETFLSECIYSLYNKALDPTKHGRENDMIKRNLVNSFIKENDADALLSAFKTKSILLSEFANITDKYYRQVLESVDRTNPDTLKIDPEISDNFYTELDMSDADDVILTIRTRVAHASEEFINKNIADKMDIEDIIQGLQDRIDSTKETDEEIKEEYNMMAKKKIATVRARTKNVYSKMVEATCEATLKNEDMKKVYMSDNKLDMDRVLESVELMYALLETVNTAKIVDIDESYIDNLLCSLV